MVPVLFGSACSIIARRSLEIYRAGSLNHDAAADATAAAENHWTRYMIDAGDTLVILKLSKNHPEHHYLKIAILLAASASTPAAASLNDLKLIEKLICEEIIIKMTEKTYNNKDINIHE